MIRNKNEFKNLIEKKQICFFSSSIWIFLVDRKELQTWYKGFLKDFPAGVIEKADFARIYKQYFPFGDSLPFANRVFEVFNGNNENNENNLKKTSLEFKEYIIGLSITSRGKLPERIACN